MQPETEAPRFGTYREIVSAFSATIDPSERVRLYSDDTLGLTRITVRNGEQELTPDELDDLCARFQAIRARRHDEALVQEPPC